MRNCANVRLVGVRVDSKLANDCLGAHGVAEVPPHVSGRHIAEVSNCRLVVPQHHGVSHALVEPGRVGKEGDAGRPHPTAAACSPRCRGHPLYMRSGETQCCRGKRSARRSKTNAGGAARTAQLPPAATAVCPRRAARPHGHAHIALMATSFGHRSARRSAA
eukprot:5077127-Prymnesium_polylepis.1